MRRPQHAPPRVEHIYAKIGASTRAGAALFAVQHGLLDGEPAGAAAALVTPGA